MSEKIGEFKGEYRWLSNFYPVDIMIDSWVYRSVEAAYQAAKNKNKRWRKICSKYSNLNAGDLKVLGNLIQLREDWDEIKVATMRYLLRKKFQNRVLRIKLLATNDAYLEEGNWWGDKFWGVCLKTGEGKNMLGKLLMEIREEIRQEMKNNAKT